MSLTDLALENYAAGYNCSEAIIRACDAYYGLDLHEEDLKMMAGFGSGMYTGLTCGALCASIAALSKMTVETKAHDHLDTLRPYRFQQEAWRDAMRPSQAGALHQSVQMPGNRSSGKRVAGRGNGRNRPNRGKISRNRLVFLFAERYYKKKNRRKQT
ncbi:C-GCAxxG-C-C family (seleno)protein [uncultured Dubosiella sp.]|uniref:C-GCAxxG-C-C family (seleno)protein n=1 Tax=uncultured Dubosiella sp. TaxID=1937011 RepID=UPI00272CF4DD|nr:C-GCAxxG-C-C family (seleno)protein [uncultured Dubosiella sp.]